MNILYTCNNYVVDSYLPISQIHITECLSPSHEGRQNVSTHTAHFYAPKPYIPMRHILSPGVKLCMGATKCAVTRANDLVPLQRDSNFINDDDHR